MRPRFFKQLMAVLCLILPFLWGGTVYSKEYIIKIKKSKHSFSKAMTMLAEEIGLPIKDSHPKGGLAMVDIKEPIEEKLKFLRSNQDIEYVVENIDFHAFDIPNDPEFSSQWALKKVDALTAWDLQKGSKDVVVAVIDTGVDTNHKDLEEHIWKNSEEVAGNGVDDDQNGFVDDVEGWDFFDNDNSPNDETSSKNPGHGTHCAGIVGAVGDNGVGTSGIAQKVTLMPVRFLGADGSGQLLSAAKAIDYAVDNGAHVISASWGAEVSRSGVKPILEAIQRAEEQGVMFVAAAANNGKSNDSKEVYPANAGFDNVISVAASDQNDQKPSWSNYGRSTVDVSSPGLNILSTLPENKTGKLSGTSMATPLVAGAVALLISQAQAEDRVLAPLEYKSIIQATGSKVAIETACACRIDVAAAIKSVTENSLTVVPNAFTIGLEQTRNVTATGGEPPYTFVSSKPEVATISPEGVLTAEAEGDTVITVTDTTGETAKSKMVFVGLPEPNEEECPFGPLCGPMCQINPSLPWCPGGGENDSDLIL